MDSALVLNQVAATLSDRAISDRLEESLCGLAAYLADLPPRRRAIELKDLVEDVLVKHEDLDAQDHRYLTRHFANSFAPFVEGGLSDEIDLADFVARVDRLVIDKVLRSANGGSPAERRCFVLCPPLILADLSSLTRPKMLAVSTEAELVSISLGIGSLYSQFGRVT
ncbi:MAG: hypothetical protein ACKVZ0_17175 [Gemmatimonadales bacterium]